MRIQCPKCHGTRRVSMGEVFYTELTTSCSYCDNDGMIDEDQHHLNLRVELAQQVQTVMRDQTAGDAYDVFAILLAGAARQLEMSPAQVFADLEKSIGKACDLKGSQIYTCESCQGSFFHPANSDCDTKHGQCAHLYDAGWRAVYVRVMTEGKLDARSRVTLLGRGGWICSACRKKKPHLMNALP